jgi:spermidine synthase
VHVATQDIRTAVEAAAPSTYDLVLLDVDNGPRHLVHQQNAQVYGGQHLEQLRQVLRPDGVLVVWAANAAPELEAAMTDAFGGCQVIPHPVQLQGRREEYLLYVSG